jgi:hypothetical protein
LGRGLEQAVVGRREGAPGEGESGQEAPRTQGQDARCARAVLGFQAQEAQALLLRFPSAQGASTEERYDHDQASPAPSRPQEHHRPSPPAPVHRSCPEAPSPAPEGHHASASPPPELADASASPPEADGHPASPEAVASVAAYASAPSSCR